MRRHVGAWLCSAVVGLGLGARPARAFDNDIVPDKLGNPDTIRVGKEDRPAVPWAQERFARFGSELILSAVPLPSGLNASLGDGGFELSFSGDLAFVHPRQTFSDGQVRDVWAVESATAPTTLFIPTLHFRKGLPFSFEVGSDISYISFSTMVAATASVKWALVEGFQWWPDIAVRAFGTVLLGTGPLNMAAGGWDVGGSYRVPLAGGAELGIYGGYQRIGVNLSSNNVDFAPDKEDEQAPTADDGVFRELQIGKVYDPSTAFTRIYFGAQVRTAVLVLGFDAASTSGSNPIATGDATKFDTNLWKLAARVGVTF